MFNGRGGGRRRRRGTSHGARRRRWFQNATSEVEIKACGWVGRSGWENVDGRMWASQGECEDGRIQDMCEASRVLPRCWEALLSTRQRVDRASYDL